MSFDLSLAAESWMSYEVLTILRKYQARLKRKSGAIETAVSMITDPYSIPESGTKSSTPTIVTEGFSTHAGFTSAIATFNKHFGLDHLQFN